MSAAERGGGRSFGTGEAINADLTTDEGVAHRTPLGDLNEAAGAAADGQPDDW